MADKHDHNHSHAHAHAISVTAANKKAFVIGIALNVAFVVVEVVAGLMTDSLALLTDAGHNASDVASLLLSLLAFGLAQKKPTEQFTYGYKKTTVLAALANAVILLVAVGVLGYESVNRLRRPEVVEGSTIAWVAAAGIVVNGISALLFFKNREKDLNVKSAYLHLLADALVSVGVVVGGVVIIYTGWFWLDPLIGLVIMIVILIGTWSLLKDSFKMAVDAVPTGVDMEEVKQTMQKVQNVVRVHHVHVWPLSTTENALTAHVVVADDLSAEERIQVVNEIRHQLLHQNIQHSTIELEYQQLSSENHYCSTHK